MELLGDNLGKLIECYLLFKLPSIEIVSLTFDPDLSASILKNPDPSESAMGSDISNDDEEAKEWLVV